MKMKPRIILVCCLTILYAMGLMGTVGAVTFDLKADWSSTTNPNGPWSYNQGAAALPLQNNYDSSNNFPNLHAWAKAAFPSQGHVPVWLQAAADGFWGGDFKSGDILMHPTSGSSSIDAAEGNVTWTSPLAGEATISGNVWYGEWDSGRSVDWRLYVNGSSAGLPSGTVSYGDSYNRDNPATFGPLVLNVQSGDILMFEGVKTPNATYPWFIGVNLSIDVKPASVVPLPPSVILLGTALLGLPLLRLRKRRG